MTKVFLLLLLVLVSIYFIYITLSIHNPCLRQDTNQEIPILSLISNTSMFSTCTLGLRQ
jgi:hypothetical protein